MHTQINIYIYIYIYVCVCVSVIKFAREQRDLKR